MTGKQRILEILELVQANGSDYASPSMTVDQALDSIEEIVKEVLGGNEREETDKWTPEVADSIALARRVIYGRNCLRSEQLGRWESK